MSNSPHVGSVGIAENTGGLLCGHPLGHLRVEVCVELLALHPLELVLRVEFLNITQTLTKLSLSHSQVARWNGRLTLRRSDLIDFKKILEI